jgi:hypothetical protein
MKARSLPRTHKAIQSEPNRKPLIGLAATAVIFTGLATSAVRSAEQDATIISARNGFGVQQLSVPLAVSTLTTRFSVVLDARSSMCYLPPAKRRLSLFR